MPVDQHVRRRLVAPVHMFDAPLEGARIEAAAVATSDAGTSAHASERARAEHSRRHSIRSVALGVLLIGTATSANAQRVWVQHGPRPNTQGQVEGIADRPVVGAVQAVAAHPTDANIV